MVACRHTAGPFNAFSRSRTHPKQHLPRHQAPSRHRWAAGAKGPSCNRSTIRTGTLLKEGTTACSRSRPKPTSIYTEQARAVAAARMERLKSTEPTTSARRIWSPASRCTSRSTPRHPHLDVATKRPANYNQQGPRSTPISQRAITAYTMSPRICVVVSAHPHIVGMNWSGVANLADPALQTIGRRLDADQREFSTSTNRICGGVGKSARRLEFTGASEAIADRGGFATDDGYPHNAISISCCANDQLSTRTLAVRGILPKSLARFVARYYPSGPGSSISEQNGLLVPAR